MLCVPKFREVSWAVFFIFYAYIPFIKMYNQEYTLFPLLILNFLLSSDVHFTLIGFGDATLSHPAVYTAGGKINFEGKYFHYSLYQSA
jgi:hypothetical protein